MSTQNPFWVQWSREAKSSIPKNPCITLKACRVFRAMTTQSAPHFATLKFYPMSFRTSAVWLSLHLHSIPQKMEPINLTTLYNGADSRYTKTKARLTASFLSYQVIVRRNRPNATQSSVSSSPVWYWTRNICHISPRTELYHSKNLFGPGFNTSRTLNFHPF